ncbi:MAG: hypothetical protein V8R90_12095 [Eubacterium sp.]|jgi:hypothetical protein
MAKIITSVDEINNIDEVASIFVNVDGSLKQLTIDAFMELLSKKQDNITVGDGLIKLENMISCSDWKLILDKTLPAQSSDGTLLDFEDLILDGTYKELRFITVMWTSASGAANLYVNNGTEPVVTLQSVLATNATFTYDFMLQNTDLPGRYLLLTAERTISGVKSTSSEVKRYQNSGSDETVPNVKNIRNLKLKLESGWSNTSARYVRVYGRK